MSDNHSLSLTEAATILGSRGGKSVSPLSRIERSRKGGKARAKQRRRESTYGLSYLPNGKIRVRVYGEDLGTYEKEEEDEAKEIRDWALATLRSMEIEEE